MERARLVLKVGVVERARLVLEFGVVGRRGFPVGVVVMHLVARPTAVRVAQVGAAGADDSR